MAQGSRVTRQESLEITAMVLTNWRVHDWSKEEIDAFATGIQHLDAEIAVSSVVRASRELKYPPRIAEFLEVYRAERASLRPIIAPPESRPKPLDLWVKRWICARFLYARFGKERDMRRFTDQGDYGDFTQEQMPEGAWVEEAEKLDDESLLASFGRGH